MSTWTRKAEVTGLKAPSLRKVSGTMKSGNSSGAQRIWLLGILAGFAFVLYGVFDGSPMPSTFSWQFVAGGFLVMVFITAESGVYTFKSKSPQIFNDSFHQSIDQTVPHEHALITMNGRSIVNDIFLLGGFKAFTIYMHGGKKNGVAIIPRNLYKRAGMTVYVAADYIKWPYEGLPRKIREKLKDLKWGFDAKTTPIYWFCIANKTYLYTIELHSQDRVLNNLYDLVSMLEDAENGYNQVTERMNANRQVFKLEDKFLRRGRVYSPRQEKEEDKYE